jgi:spermidine/putrescine transport system substrate-binding protein
VLAHLFLDYLLDFETSVKNYSWNGYQPPQKRLDPALLVERGYVPAYLHNAIVRRADFNRGFMQLELSPEVDDLWHRAYAEFRATVRRKGGLDRS